MYCLKLVTPPLSKPVIYLEGRIESVSTIEPQLNNILYDLKDSDEICIDLDKIESICHNCLKMFQRFQKIYPLSFRGYSLYIETQLLEYKLLKLSPQINK